MIALAVSTCRSSFHFSTLSYNDTTYKDNREDDRLGFDWVLSHQAFQIEHYLLAITERLTEIY